MPSDITVSMGRGRPATRTFSLSPSSSSLTMKARPSCSPMSQTEQMLGWFNAEASCASLRKRARRAHRRRVLGKELQRHETVEASILGPVDDTHPAPAQFVENAVVRDRLADHQVEILGKSREPKSIEANG